MKKAFIQLWHISAVLVILGSCITNKEDRRTSLPYYNKADFTPEWIDKDDPQYDNIHKISDFEFVNQNGMSISNASFDGKIYVANFFFTICPSICPKMTSNLNLARAEFEGDSGIAFISHSVMPWIDSVDVLKNFAASRNVDTNQWHFVTGNTEQIYSLARNDYFAEKEIGIGKSSDEFVHTENCILVDKEGRIRGVYNGTLSLEMKRLIEDINTLKEMG